MEFYERPSSKKLAELDVEWEIDFVVINLEKGRTNKEIVQILNTEGWRLFLETETYVIFTDTGASCVTSTV